MEKNPGKFVHKFPNKNSKFHANKIAAGLQYAFQFVAGESESDCAIFFIGDVDEIVSLTITELNMRESCNQQDEYVKVR